MRRVRREHLVLCLMMLVLVALLQTVAVMLWWSSRASDDYCGNVVSAPGPPPNNSSRFRWWLARQASLYQLALCSADPRSVETLAAHVPFERAYIRDVLLATLPPFEGDDDDDASRGVVFTARADPAPLAQVLRTVRLLEPEGLQVEVWFAEPVVPHAHPLCQHARVRCRGFYSDADGLVTREWLPPSGYAFCVYAILLSAFRHVLFLDVDAAPLRAVRPLFDSPAYRRTGQLFWADFWGSDSAHAGHTAHADSHVWDLVRVRPYATREMETSVLLIDKRRNWREANVALHLARHGQLMARQAPRGYPKAVHGDKDLWRLAFLYLRTPMLMATPAMLGSVRFGLWFRRESFGHVGPGDLRHVLFVHQPKVLALPRYSALTHYLVDTHCRDVSRGYFTYGGPRFWDFWPCIHAYNFRTGALSGDKRQLPFWLLHECAPNSDADDEWAICAAASPLHDTD